jgi:predicted metal-dependent HD superfamily phosphohydrolase
MVIKTYGTGDMERLTGDMSSKYSKMKQYILDSLGEALRSSTPDIYKNFSNTIFNTNGLRERIYYDKDKCVLGDIRKEIMKKKLDPELHYHNVMHELYAAVVGEDLALREGLDYVSARRVVKALLFHDEDYIPGNPDNEEIAAKRAWRFLKDQGDNKKEIDEVERLILATKMSSYPSHDDPGDISEQIMRDSDIAGLGGGTLAFILSTELLRREESTMLGRNIGLKEWYEGNEKFMDREYYTKNARRLRGDNFKRNRTMVKWVLGELDKLEPIESDDVNLDDYSQEHNDYSQERDSGSMFL